MIENDSLQTTPRRERRRIVRPSDAEDIDRSADQPDDSFGTPTSWDNEREVILDDGDTPPPTENDDFWNEERPPHYS